MCEVVNADEITVDIIQYNNRDDISKNQFDSKRQLQSISPLKFLQFNALRIGRRHKKVSFRHYGDVDEVHPVLMTI